MDINEILAQVEEQDVRLLDFWYVDLLGSIKSITISLLNLERLERLLRIGIRSEATSLSPELAISSNTITLIPDLNTFKVLPWTQDKPDCYVELCTILQRNGRKYPVQPGHTVARIFCNLSEADAQSIFSPRNFLSQQLKSLKETHGYHYKVGPELEFHLFSPSRKLLDKGNYLNIENCNVASDIRQAIVLFADAIGFDIEYHHHEVGQGQQEIDFRRDDALNMADKVLTYKALVKETARLFGQQASFMPKPFNESQGNGMHVHQSLWQEQLNRFHQADSEFNFSATGRQFAAGLLNHAREITAVTNQWANSYKRIVPDFEAPVFIGWGPSNRSTLIRVPRLSPTGNLAATRIEYRAPDPACNPYLTFSVMLGAGMNGIHSNQSLPRPIKENMYAIPKSELELRGIGMLPTSLGEALSEFEDSALLKALWGEPFHQHYLSVKKTEWNNYSRQISDFELNEMLRLEI